MDSDDEKDAKEPRKKASIFQRAASVIKKPSKKEQSSTDSGDISENKYPFGAFEENIEESKAGHSNPSPTKSREDDSLLPSISELMEKAYPAKIGDDNDNFVLESLKEILLKKSADDKSVAKETDSNSEEVRRPPLLANLHLDSIFHLASYNEALFPTHHKEDPTLTGAGLRNLGNTCFMNSVLQCLVHTVPLYGAILSENHSLKCDCEHALLKGICLSCYMRHIFRSSTSGRGDFAPMGLANSLKYISATFSKGKQGDAHEFLTMLWTRLKECHVKDSPYESLIKRVFGGVALIKLTCCGCKNSSERTQEIYDVQLPIQNTDNLVGAILSHIVAKVNYSCENCGKEEGAIQRVMLHEVPSIATFQLKRFDNEMNKIEKDVSFPLVLDLLPFTAEADAEMNYELYAVIVHRGSTLKEGHYYCFIQISPDHWIRFDDDRVSRVHKDQVLSQEAYILFYAKQGTAWFIDSIIAKEATNDSASSAIENEASTSSDSLNDDGKFGAYDVYDPFASSGAPVSEIDDGKSGAYSVDDPSSSSRAPAASEIDDGKSGVYSVGDPSSSSRAPAASEVDDGRHGVRLAPIEEEGEEEGESEDLEARRSETEEE